MAGPKKASKDDKEKLKAEEAERKRKEEEEERRLTEETEAVRRQEAAEVASKAKEAELARRRQRREQLRQSGVVTEEYERQMTDTRRRLTEEEEWCRLMRCDGLPDPHNVPEVTRYLSLWRDTGTLSYGTGITMDTCMEATKEMIQVIDDLEYVMQGAEDPSEKQRRHWKEILVSLLESLHARLDEATYTQLLDLRPHLDHDTAVYSFFQGSPLVSIALWSNTTRSLKNASHEVEELGLRFTLPPSLLRVECVVRVMRTSYDHYSKFSSTFVQPPVQPPTRTLLDIAEASLAEMECAADAGVSADTERPGGRSTTEDRGPPPVTEVSPEEINLRRHRVQGGVWTIDLLRLPPQPRALGPHCTVKQVEEQCTVSTIHWVSDYQPPAASQPGSKRKTPQDLERETRERELELNKLVLIAIKLPDSAFWFEPPQMSLWEPDKKMWTTDCFHDIKYNEEQRILQVRTARLGVLGLTMSRFCNLPFQHWQLQPDEDGRGAELELLGAVVTATITIGEGTVSVKELKDGNRMVLSHLYGEEMKTEKLIQTLQQYGINLFPDPDSYCYMAGLPLKHRATEAHTYYCMALMATVAAFSWSRWNLLAGEDNLVFQMKFLEKQSEAAKGSEETQLLVLVTPERSAVSECTELSQSFTTRPQDDSKFFADLYHLGVGEGGSRVEAAMRGMPSLLTHTITTMLAHSSVLSYC